MRQHETGLENCNGVPVGRVVYGRGCSGPSGTVWVPRAPIRAELAFVARTIKGEETREDRLQTCSLSLQREVCIPGEAEAPGLNLGMEMDSTSRSSSTCYRSPKAEIFLSCA